MIPTAIPAAYERALQRYRDGRLAETETLCRDIIATAPLHADALHLLGIVGYRAGHLAPAIELIRRAIAVAPRVADFHANLGAVLNAAGRPAEGREACFRALSIDPDHVDAHYNLANAARDAGDPDGACSHYREAIARRPAHAAAHNNLGNVLRDGGRVAAAIESYRRALALRPDDAHARSNYANALRDAGLPQDAVDEHRRAVASLPTSAAIHSNLLLALQADDRADATAIDAESARWDARHGNPPRVPTTNDRDPDRPLRVGYVSGDLRLHSVAYFLTPLVEAHDGREVRVVGYSTGGRADAVTARLRAACSGWCDLAGLSDDAAAERIRGDRIDVLVDLSGHTSDNRLGVFARAPAPVSVSYLGYPGPTGLSRIDARLSDALADPQESVGGERVMHLAGGAWCFAPFDSVTPGDRAPAATNGHPTFGSFNHPGKTSPTTIALWSDLLGRLPTARLLLKNRAFRDPQTATRVRAAFASHGVAGQRIDCVADLPTAAEHLRAYDGIDVALDPFPYHGTTTTCEALWMGVPVVTMTGDRHASRVGASLLSSVGLSSLVATTADAYVATAVAAAADVDRLSRWRRELRERMAASPLTDGHRLAREIETTYRGLWREWCASPA